MEREAICRNRTDYLEKFRFFHLMSILPNNPTGKQKNLEYIILHSKRYHRSQATDDKPPKSPMTSLENVMFLCELYLSSIQST